MVERLPQKYIPIHYDLYVRIIPEFYPFEARVTITFQKNDDADEVILFLHTNLTVHKVLQNGERLDFICEFPKLIIKRSQAQDISEQPITIEYTILPNLIYRTGFFVHKGNYLTDFEPNGARRLMPCFDEPCVRSTFTVRIQIPKELTGISNMPIDGITDATDDEKLIVFQKTPSMCTYLLCICVGTFSEISGITANDLPVHFYGQTGKEEQFYELLQVATFAVDWIEANFGVKYELPHLQLISYEGCPNGMENYGLITLSDYSRRGYFFWKAKVVIHEVIHQWFGDLVALKWWNSLWLNEGFAQFIQYLILDDYAPEANAKEMIAFNDGFHCFRYFRGGRVVPPESEVSFRGLFDSLVYVKGAYILKMFYKLVGRDSFFRICSNWLNKFKNKNAEVPDFIQVVNSTLNNDFSNFFNTWLRLPGFPVLFVEEIVYNKRRIGIRISQTSQNDVPYRFVLPIRYEYNGEIKKVEVEMIDDVLYLHFNFDWVMVNDDLGALCFVLYSKNLLISLLKPNYEHKLNKLNKSLIMHSVRSGAIPYLVNDEIVRISNQFYY